MTDEAVTKAERRKMTCVCAEDNKNVNPEMGPTGYVLHLPFPQPTFIIMCFFTYFVRVLNQRMYSFLVCNTSCFDIGKAIGKLKMIIAVRYLYVKKLCTGLIEF